MRRNILDEYRISNKSVIPAKAGIQSYLLCTTMDSRLRGNDEGVIFSFYFIYGYKYGVLGKFDNKI